MVDGLKYLRLGATNSGESNKISSSELHGTAIQLQAARLHDAFQISIGLPHNFGSFSRRDFKTSATD